jgi:nicotinamidase-related amidase
VYKRCRAALRADDPVALVVVDLTPEFVLPGGPLYPRTGLVGDAAPERVAATAAAWPGPILCLVDHHPEGRGERPGEPPHARSFVPALPPLDGFPHATKQGYGGAVEVLAALPGLGAAVVCGVRCSVCVRATAVGLRQRGVRVAVHLPWCFDWSARDRDRGARLLREQGGVPVF